MIKRLAYMLALVASALLTLLASTGFHLNYLRWRDCFNEQGRCFDAQTATVYHQQSGMVWGGVAAISLLMTVFLARALLKRACPENEKRPTEQ